MARGGQSREGMSWARWPQRVAQPLHRVGRCPPALPPPRECPTWDWARDRLGLVLLVDATQSPASSSPTPGQSRRAGSLVLLVL